MSLFISNSKHKKYCLLFLIGIITIYIAAIMFLRFVDSRMTNKNHFIDDKFSKAKHMLLNFEKPKDIIFIGNSRTLYHISTNLFETHGIDIYNFGASGRNIADYPWMVKQALKNNAEIIAISIDAQDLYLPPKATNAPEIFDLISYLKSNQDKLFIAREIINYFKSQNTIWAMSPIILTHLHDLFNIENKKDTSIKQANIIAPSKKPLIDCTPFKIEHLKEIKTQIECTNGDGILLGTTSAISEKTITLTNTNNQTINLVNQIIKTINESGKTPIILLIPSVHSATYIFNVSYLKSIIHAKVIDLSNEKFSASMWTEDGHLNNSGRIKYSSILIKKLYHQEGNKT